MLMIRNLNEPELPGFCSYGLPPFYGPQKALCCQDGSILRLICRQLLVQGYLHVVSNLVTSRSMGEEYHKHTNPVKMYKKV